MVPMTRSLSEICFVHVGSDDFVVIRLPVLGFQELQHSIIDAGAMWEERVGAWRNLVKEEKTPVLTDLSRIALRGFC